MADTESEDQAPEEPDQNHLQHLSDGAGCTEIWEHLSDFRDAENEEETDGDKT